MSGPLEYLPQGDEVWLFLARKSFGFLEDNKGNQVRPWMALLFEIAPRTELYHQEVYTDEMGELPDKDFVLKILEDTMKTDRPALKQPARRPRAVIFTNEKIFKELAKPLWNNGVTAKLWTEEENQGFGDDYVKLFSTKLREKQGLGYKTSALKPGLKSILKTKDRLKTFYEASAELYKVAPWKHFPKPGTFFIVSWPEQGTRIFFLYPQKNEDIRIGIETSPEELQHLFTTGERATLDEGVPGAYHRCLFYTDDFSLPFDDLHDLDTLNFPLGADPQKESFVYPFPIAFRKDMGNFFRPPIGDLEWMEIGCHAITQFVKDLEQKKIQPENNIFKKIEYTVPLFNRHTTLQVSVVNQDWEGLKNLWKEVFIEEKAPVFDPVAIEASDHDPNACKVCKLNKGAPLQKCGRCKIKLYCSRECQAKDWPKHKTVCTPPKDTTS